MCSEKFRAAALFFLVLIWVLAVHGQTVAGWEEPREAATGFPAAAGNAIGHVPYLSLGIALIRPKDTRFFDGGDAGHASLYGSRFTFDTGAVGSSFEFHLAPGVRLPSGLRLQMEFNLARAPDGRGNTNYRNSGGHQPSGARLDTWQFLPAGFYDFPGWELDSGRRVQPFLGAGLGITGCCLSDYVQRFPEPDNPQGSLRRGSGGEIPYTALPGGNGQNTTWMLTAGVAIPIGRSIHFDLSYRYIDAGEIGTEIGDIVIVRYRENGTRRRSGFRSTGPRPTTEPTHCSWFSGSNCSSSGGNDSVPASRSGRRCRPVASAGPRSGRRPGDCPDAASRLVTSL